MTNRSALIQLRETASKDEALRAIDVGIQVLIAQGMTPEEIERECHRAAYFFAKESA